MVCEMAIGALVMDGVTEGRTEVESARGIVVRIRRDIVVIYIALEDLVGAVEYLETFVCISAICRACLRITTDELIEVEV